jgi:hypothetical protein
MIPIAVEFGSRLHHRTMKRHFTRGARRAFMTTSTHLMCSWCARSDGRAHYCVHSEEWSSLLFLTSASTTTARS